MSFFKEINIRKEKIIVKRNLRSILFEVSLLLFSSVLLAFSFPSLISIHGLGFLAFFALIPLFAVITNTSWRCVGFYGFLYGFVFYWIFNYWLSSFHPYANLIVQIIKACEMVLLFFALKAADKFFSDKFSFILQSFIWVAYAYLSQSWFAGYPYGSIAYSVYNYRLLIQIADFSGIWLLTFMLVFPQAFLGKFLCCRLSKTVCKSSAGIFELIKENKFSLIFYVVLFLFQIVYGVITLSYWVNKKPDKTFKVVAVQHNADSWSGGFQTYEHNFNTLVAETREALSFSFDVDMVVWSETAFVPSVSWYTKYPYTGDGKGYDFDYLRKIQKLVSSFVKFGTELNIPLLTGNPTSVLAEGTDEPYTEAGDWNNKVDYNSVILFDDGIIKQTYTKQHLVPFTEHFPYEKLMPHFYQFLKKHDYHWWEEGTESVVFETSNGITFSTPICFEDVFGYICAEFVKNGANLLVNMTNDNWSKSVVAEYQHAAMAVFRSVETRKSTLRGTNSGITCLITAYGEIKDEMQPFKEGWKLYSVPIYESELSTLYVNVSDLPVKIFSFIILIFIIVFSCYRFCCCFLKKKLKKKFKNN